MKQVKMNTLIRLTVAFLAILALTFFACTKQQEKEAEVIKIGAILPLTGPIAWLGTNIKTGVNLALEEINATRGESGRKVEVVFEDSKGKPNEAVTLVNKAIAVDNVDFLMVLGTGPVNAILPIVEKSNKLLFGFTIHPGITKKSENLFRVYISGDQEWPLLAKYINESGFTKIGILHINAEYGIDSKEILQNNLCDSVKILYAEPYEIGQSDFRSILSRVKDKKVEAIVLMGYGKEYLPMLKQMREMKIDAKVLGNIDFVYDFVRKDPLAEGAVFVAPSFSFGELTQKGEGFVKSFRAKYNREPAWDEAYGYDTIMLISRAVSFAKSIETTKVKNAILQMKSFKGASGELVIDKDGDTKTPMAIATLKEGKVVRYE